MQIIEEPTMKVQLLRAHAIPPLCAHPSEDLGYDIFAAEDAVLWPLTPTQVYTGIAVELRYRGFLLRDRSSMAKQGVIITGGVIDAGYRGEIIVLMTYIVQPAPPLSTFSSPALVKIYRGSKIAQMIPVRPDTYEKVQTVKSLSETARGAAGFGSTGS